MGQPDETAKQPDAVIADTGKLPELSPELAPGLAPDLHASEEAAPEPTVSAPEPAKAERVVDPEVAAEAASTASRRSLGDFFPIMSRPRLSRIGVMTIAIALSAAAGSAVGAMAAVTFAKPDPASSENARTIEVNALRGVITQLSAEVSSLKATLDANAKTASSQLNKIAERVERSEKAQAEPVARVAKLSELLERIEKRTAAASVPPAAAGPTLASAAPETTGSIAPKQQERPAVVSSWVLRDVYRGRAMVESQRFGMYEVIPGVNLPGIGRVETIRRQDGRWVVVTPRGLIVER